MKNKAVIVTGAASGIGEATAKLFAEHGAKVVVSDIDEGGGRKVVEAIKKAGGEAMFVKTDVSDAADMKALVAATVEAYGGLDAAINNAGISGMQAGVAELSEADWEQTINVNLNGVFYGMKYQIEAMLQRGGGSIVNVSSILGSVGFEGAAAYVAAKHGLLGLTKVAALEYSGHGVRVNAVGPAFIDTPLLAALDDNMKKMLVGMHPIGRLGRSEEVAELIFWLASDKASFVTGSYHPIDGGYLSR